MMDQAELSKFIATENYTNSIGFLLPIRVDYPWVAVVADLYYSMRNLFQKLNQYDFPVYGFLVFFDDQRVNLFQDAMSNNRI